MIQARPSGDNTRRDDIADHIADRRGRLPLTDEQIARQMRSRRRQLEILRRMIAEREGRSDGN